MILSLTGTDNENELINIIVKYLLLSIPGGVLSLCFIGLVIWTVIKPLMRGNSLSGFLNPING